ncbi:MAG: diaminopimelate decarboxylase [Pseudomonadota bacterium]|jgi:diaminopimelate decarboxylase
MEAFTYQSGVLYAESVDLQTIAEKYGTPCYVYSQTLIEENWLAFDAALGEQPHLICYAVKANSNLSILKLLAQLGSGFDLVSGGELEKVLMAGAKPQQIVFSGVGKSDIEIQRALEIGIGCFNVESAAELSRIQTIAKHLNKQAPISIRVNPDVDAQTHPYISTGLKENKFGIEINHAINLYQMANEMSHLQIIGVDCHIGSQLTSLSPFLDALDRVLHLIAQLEQKGIAIKHLDMGGGLGVRYREETPPTISEYISAIKTKLAGKSYQLLLEPGRAIIANAGILLTKVAYLKAGAEDKHFAIVDAAMNDLIRPALYSAWQNIIPVKQNDLPTQYYDVVGPICETGDFLGKNRELAIEENDLLAICSAGAYGFAMSSNYNSRPRVAEVLVKGEEHRLIRRRETFEEMVSTEMPFLK